MEILWFWLVAAMLTAYVVLDGFDIGAGIVQMFVAQTDAERRQVILSIGPVWDANEVWLIAAGGTLYFAFPPLYSSSFSGFYLPLMMVLWLLILRGVSIEFGNHMDTPLWRRLWNLVFAFASALLAIFFGAALGNVIRGVPLDATGFFFLPLWTNFQPVKEAGILDWYTISVALTAFAALALHGATWVALKTDGDLHARSRAFARSLWWWLAALTVLVTVLSFQIQPHLAEQYLQAPWGVIFPAAAIAGLVGIRLYESRGMEGRAFAASCVYIAGMMISAAFGVFPYVLPANSDRNLGLTIYNSATSQYGLKIGLAWWIPGMLLVAGYFVFTYRQFGGKVSLKQEY
jgi:cytochrome d ubiquinol oxidase subunit II